MRRIHRDHVQNFFRRNIWEFFLKRAHLREQIQIVIARQTVRAETDVESKLTQFLKLKWRMAEIFVTSRTMHDRKSLSRSRKQIKIVIRAFWIAHVDQFREPPRPD